MAAPDSACWVDEPARRTALYGEVDVAVIGGGPAGIAAAVSAARHGARAAEGLVQDTRRRVGRGKIRIDELHPRRTGPALRAQVQGEPERLLDAVSQDLADRERRRMIVVVREPWSIESGGLTPTTRIRRTRSEAAVSRQVERWYDDRQGVQWS